MAARHVCACREPILLGELDKCALVRSRSLNTLYEPSNLSCDRVEQPVGTGFAIGKPNATTQEETAEDFVRFFKNFQELFGIRNFKIYVTGESYAGRYVRYISAAMLDRNDTEHYDLKGE